jgi:hypothetical protein
VRGQPKLNCRLAEHRWLRKSDEVPLLNKLCPNVVSVVWVAAPPEIGLIVAMNADQEKAMEQVLKDALSRSIDMLKFGEAKNAALITFSSAWLVAMFNLSYRAEPLPDKVHFAFMWSSPFVVISLIVSFWSIVPQLNPKKFVPGKRARANLRPNLLFYRHAGDVAPLRFARELQIRYISSGIGIYTDDYLNDLGAQVAINGKIASRKFGYANVSICVLGIGVAMFLFVIFVWPLISGLSKLPK